ncbi:arpin isoform X2 [Sceloporus undulatus]|uniref:arpin isoform X2 n=1 Tax=Sceloporus undulatus TaxID=8520 RepID=UPI001C4BBD32|nr:arpin isoform X2 [Sceloporus undulatus]
MSRLYDPRCLRRTKAEVHTERLEGGRWEPGAWQRGDGVIVEGHFIWDASGRKERYFVLYVKPRTIHRRRFDPKGNEVEPNFSETRKVSTGFLPASYLSLAKLEAGTLTKCNFSGDRQAGASWTESILACKDHREPFDAPREDGDGANGDEWED